LSAQIVIVDAFAAAWTFAANAAATAAMTPTRSAVVRFVLIA